MPDTLPPVLTIDGPSGSGKGTISRAVAGRLGWHYLDSGALYRAVGVAAGWSDLDLSDASALVRCAFDTDIAFREDGGEEPRVIVTADATDELRTETAGAAASAIAAIPVRTALRRASVRSRQSWAGGGRARHGHRDLPGCRVQGVFDRSAGARRKDAITLIDKGVSVTLDGLLGSLAREHATPARRGPLRPPTTPSASHHRPCRSTHRGAVLACMGGKPAQQPPGGQ